MSQTLLFYNPPMEPLARKTAARNNQVALGTIDWRKFENAWPAPIIRDPRAVRGANVALLASLQTPGDAMELYYALYGLKCCGARHLTIRLPHIPSATKDRVDMAGDVVSAKAFMHMLSTLPRKAGTLEIFTYDIHSAQEQDFVGADMLATVESAMPLLIEAALHRENSCFVCPDAGAYKRYKDLIPKGIPVVICHKEHLGDATKKKVVIIEGSPRGLNCVTFDDLINLGGTNIACADTLHDHGARSVSATAVHGSCPQESWKRFLDEKIDEVHISDSCPWTVEAVKHVPKFKVTSLAALEAASIVNR